jgi:glycosyltransferase involved in cell wall biosynthesis
LRSVTRARDYSLYYACDLDTAWTLARASRKTRVPVVFDQFDQFADRISTQPIHAALARMERRTITAANAVVVASPERAKELTRECFVVENIPDVAVAEHPMPAGEEQQGLSAFYGGVLHSDRGLDQAVAAAKACPDWTLRIGGFGPLEQWAAQAAADNPNIEFLGVLTPEEIVRQAMSSSVLLALYDPSLRNNVTTASGKFWDALVAGTPVVAARGTAVATKVDAHRLGWTIDYGEPEQLAEALRARAAWDRQHVVEFRSRARMLLNEHAWPAQRDRLVAAIDSATRAVDD